jgi:hypothetical protein
MIKLARQELRRNSGAPLLGLASAPSPQWGHRRRRVSQVRDPAPWRRRADRARPSPLICVGGCAHDSLRWRAHTRRLALNKSCLESRPPQETSHAGGRCRWRGWRSNNDGGERSNLFPCGHTPTSTHIHLHPPTDGAHTHALSLSLSASHPHTPTAHRMQEAEAAEDGRHARFHRDTLGIFFRRPFLNVGRGCGWSCFQHPL